MKKVTLNRNLDKPHTFKTGDKVRSVWNRYPGVVTLVYADVVDLRFLNGVEQRAAWVGNLGKITEKEYFLEQLKYK